MGMINLKPCPFCGSERVKLFTYSTGGICVKCYDCCCQTGAFSDSFSDDATTVSAAERVVKAWNKRKWLDEEAVEKGAKSITDRAERMKQPCVREDLCSASIQTEVKLNEF